MTSQPPQLPPSSETAFSKVPLEVFLRITDHLSTSEHGSLRLTCRSIERSLFTTFSKEFFSKKQFMLTEGSLQALLDMSKSRIGDCLKHIIIGLDYYKKGVRVETHVKNTLYTAGFDDQQTLLWTGHALVMLADAFRNLQPTVVAMRDYASEARQIRDGSRTRWASYGATTVWNETGVSLLGAVASDGEVSAYASQVFSIIMAALASSNHSPKTIEVLRHHGGSLRPTAFNIPKYLEPSLLPVLSRIETIFLPINIVGTQNLWGHTSPARFVSIDGSSDTMIECPDYLLRIFLSHLSSLKHLRLNFRRSDTPTDLIKWLASPTPQAAAGGDAPPNPTSVTHAAKIPSPPPGVSFPHLENLELGILNIDQTTLLSVVRKFAPTLKGVELWKVTLQSNISDTDGVPDRHNAWQQFLGKMRQIRDLKLKHMMVGQPTQGDNSARYDVFFKSLLSKKTTGVLQKRAYLGNEWDEWMQDLSADVVVQWPEMPVELGSDDEMTTTDYDL
ncbi:hypothetical protein ACHAQH_002360 [Verticillium albo-atrum]